MNRRPPRSTLFPSATLFRSLPQPPPPGVERRGRERMALELAGVCIGLLGDPVRQAPGARDVEGLARLALIVDQVPAIDRKSTRLNSSHGYISYAGFCLKKKH